ncbi:uncharacterized protein LOC143533365 [Bidens hawaiensis]|uniref:uncharacterized protein LOC143533365 n=1 Tax=Bidens hawaiensis TaxID=980011 RepID=UPI00404AFB63
MDFAFGQKTDKRPFNDSDPFQDDLFADMDSVFQAKDGLSDDLNSINLKNTDVDWFSDGNWQASSVNNMDTVKDVNLFQDDDGFDGWNDFTSSTGNQDSWKENSNEKVGDCENFAELNLFPSTDNSQEVDFGKLLMSDIFSGDNNPSDTQLMISFQKYLQQAGMLTGQRMMKLPLMQRDPKMMYRY